jgi:hypothetical protein
MPDVESQPPPSPAPPVGAPPAAASDVVAAQAAAPLDYDPLSRLKKMSTTAGVGTGDYVAINPVAVAASLLGLASVAVLLSDILLVIPLAGVVCAVIAWRQVRNSNGTQTGAGLAVAGLVLSLLLGGGVFGSRMVIAWTRHNDEALMASVAGQLGQELANQRYDEAFDRFGPRFRDRIGRMKFPGSEQDWANLTPADREQRARKNFGEAFEGLRQTWDVGGIRGLEWNRQVIYPEDAAEAGLQVAWVGILPEFERPIKTKPRWQLKFVKEDGKWVIEDFPDIFPAERKAKR